MKTTKLISYIAVSYSRQQPEADIEAVLHQLHDGVDSYPFRFAGEWIPPTEIRMLSTEECEKNPIVAQFPDRVRERADILRISSDVPLDVFSGISETHLESHTAKVASNETKAFLANGEFCKGVSDLLLMTHLAQLGSIGVIGSIVVQDDEASDFSGIPNMYVESAALAASAAREFNWPPLTNPSLPEIWAWILRNYDMMHAFDGSSLGRALNAFSRIFDASGPDELVQLMWSLVGIEALYASSHADIIRQVRERSSLLLGLT